MIRIERTTSKNSHFESLVSTLDTYLEIVDGADHDFYHQFNGIEALDHVVLAFDDTKAVGCGAFKQLSEDTIEIKRMYVVEQVRGQGVASIILKELEKWAKEKGFLYSNLETGARMPDAIGLYVKNGYIAIANYGPYIGMDNSRCFQKILD